MVIFLYLLASKLTYQKSFHVYSRFYRQLRLHLQSGNQGLGRMWLEKVLQLHIQLGLTGNAPASYQHLTLHEIKGAGSH